MSSRTEHPSSCAALVHRSINDRPTGATRHWPSDSQPGAHRGVLPDDTADLPLDRPAMQAA
ncbi:hypothetical protein [Nocardia xishanensis]